MWPWAGWFHVPWSSCRSVAVWHMQMLELVGNRCQVDVVADVSTANMRTQMPRPKQKIMQGSCVIWLVVRWTRRTWVCWMMSVRWGVLDWHQYQRQHPQHQHRERQDPERLLSHREHLQQALQHDLPLQHDHHRWHHQEDHHRGEGHQHHREGQGLQPEMDNRQRPWLQGSVSWPQWCLSW